MDFATKYRPYTFSAVVGQGPAVAALQGKLANPSDTYLISGPRGTGKTTLARIFARTINCREPSTCTRDNPCVSCEAFLAAGGKHPDIIEQNGADARGIDDVRQLIDISKFSPNNKYRVFILDEMHQLTPQAQEALLKPFEEPSARTVWILCTTNPEKIKSTIVSRAFKTSVSLLSNADMETAIQHVVKAENIPMPPEIMRAIIESADGHVREAYKTLEVYASAVSVGGTADIHALAQQIQNASPIMIAMSYMKGQIMKEPGRVFSAPALSDAKDRFLMDVIDCYRALIYKASGAIDLFQAHPQASRLYNVSVGPESLGALSYHFQEHVSALGQLKTYTMSERDILDAVAAKCYAVSIPVR